MEMIRKMLQRDGAVMLADIFQNSRHQDIWGRMFFGGVVVVGCLSTADNAKKEKLHVIVKSCTVIRIANHALCKKLAD